MFLWIKDVYVTFCYETPTCTWTCSSNPTEFGTITAHWDICLNERSMFTLSQKNKTYFLRLTGDTSPPLLTKKYKKEKNACFSNQPLIIYAFKEKASDLSTLPSFIISKKSWMDFKLYFFSFFFTPPPPYAKTKWISMLTHKWNNIVNYQWKELDITWPSHWLRKVSQVSDSEKRPQEIWRPLTGIERPLGSWVSGVLKKKLHFFHFCLFEQKKRGGESICCRWSQWRNALQSKTIFFVLKKQQLKLMIIVCFFGCSKFYSYC